MRNKLLGVFAALIYCGAAAAEPWNACRQVEAYPGEEWIKSDPAALGWDKEALLDAKAQFEALQSASVVVVHKGRLIAEWGDSAERFTAQSVRKGLLNSLVGKLVDENALSPDDTLAELHIDDIEPPLTDLEKTATVRDLLRSRSGVFHSALYEVGGWKRMRAALAEKKGAGESDRYAPGEYWIYNNWDFNALGTIVEQASGEPIGRFFENAIAGPIGMQDFRPEDVEYTTKDDMTEKRFENVSVHRAYMFNISTRDLARYGLLFLGCGEWDGERIISREWVLKSLDGVDTRLGRAEDERKTGFGDYGFLWQIDRPGSRRYDSLKTRGPAYFATGNRGHLLAVFPYLDLVVAHQVGTRGGVSAEAQIKRARFGSPEVRDDEMIKLLTAIIEAYHEGGAAFVED